MYSTRILPLDAAGMRFGPTGAGYARYLTEQRGATRLAVVAGGTEAGAGDAAETAIRVVRAARFIPVLCREPRFWTDLLASADAYLCTSAGRGTCSLTVAAVVEDQVVGASVGDVGAWLFTPTGAIELTGAADGDARLGSARAEPVAFGPVPFAGALLLASAALWRTAATSRLAEVVAGTTPGQAVRALASLVEADRTAAQAELAAVVVANR